MLAYAGVGSGGATGATHSDLAAKLAAAQQRCNRGATESPKSEEARDATDAADTDAADTGTDAADTDTEAADAQFKEQAVNGRALLGTQFTCFTSTNRYSGNSYLLY